MKLNLYELIEIKTYLKFLINIYIHLRCVVASLKKIFIMWGIRCPAVSINKFLHNLINQLSFKNVI